MRSSSKYQNHIAEQTVATTGPTVTGATTVLAAEDPEDPETLLPTDGSRDQDELEESDDEFFDALEYSDDDQQCRSFASGIR